jgi:hypothetical protein
LPLALAAFAATFALILTLLYVQWTGFGAPTVQGFQGRYLYPVLSGLLMALPRRPAVLFGLSTTAWIAALAATATATTLAMTVSTYLV